MTPHPPNVLLADGDPASREQFRSFFERVGWRYALAGNDSELLSAVSGKEFDVIITDVAMEGADGMQLLGRILQQKPSQAIIAVSKDASLEEAIRYFRSGAADLVPRPIDFAWLERSVQQLVQGIRDDERERRSNRFLATQSSVYILSSAQLSEIGFVSLPIVSQLRDSHVLGEQDALRLRLAIQETVVNALEHGNLELLSEWKEEVDTQGTDRFSKCRKERLAQDKYRNREVRISTAYEPGRLTITVRDAGCGFLNSIGPQEADRSGVVRCYGRGLALISSAVDELHFDHNGAEVTLIKKLAR